VGMIVDGDTAVPIVVWQMLCPETRGRISSWWVQPCCSPGVAYTECFYGSSRQCLLL